MEALIARLERLWRKLEDEGRYTDANTVALAIEQQDKLGSYEKLLPPEPEPEGGHAIQYMITNVRRTPTGYIANFKPINSWSTKWKR